MEVGELWRRFVDDAGELGDLGASSQANAGDTLSYQATLVAALGPGQVGVQAVVEAAVNRLMHANIGISVAQYSFTASNGTLRMSLRVNRTQEINDIKNNVNNILGLYISVRSSSISFAQRISVPLDKPTAKPKQPAAPADPGAPVPVPPTPPAPDKPLSMNTIYMVAGLGLLVFWMRR
jgi:hypothetical protein